MIRYNFDQITYCNFELLLVLLLLGKNVLKSFIIRIFPIVLLFIISISIVSLIAHFDFIFNLIDFIYWIISFSIVAILSVLWFLFLPVEIIIEKKGLTRVEFSELDLLKGRREIVIAALLAGIFISFRYIIYPHPQGWDTAYYLYHLKKLVINFNYVFSLPRERVFTFLILYVINIIFINPNITIMITPIIFAMLFVIGVVSLVWELTGDHELGFYAGVISAVAFSTSRLFLDLYCNFIAWTFTMFALLYVARIVKRPEPSVKNLTIFSLFSFIIAFTHPWTLFVYLGILLVFILILFMFMRKEAIDLITLLLVSLIPTTIAALSQPNVAWTLIRSIFYSYIRYPLQLSEREDPLIAFTALLGAFYILTIRKKTILHGIIIAWYITISFLFATGAYYHSYRLLNLMPIGILAAFGLRYLNVEVPKYMHDTSGRLGFIRRFLKYRSKLLVTILLVIIVLTALPNSYLPDHTNRPNEYYMGQLKWISNHFGFENKSIIVLINKPIPMANYPLVGNYLDWAVSELGQVVYPGSLLDYIQHIEPSLVPQKPFYFPQIPNYTPNLILIPDRWYVISHFELFFAREIPGTGIYIIYPEDIKNFRSVLCNISRLSLPILDVEFEGLSHFNVTYINNVTYFSMNFTVLSKDSKLILDIYTYPVIFNYVILNISGPNIAGLDITVSLWSNSTKIDEKKVNDYLEVNNDSVYIPLLTYSNPCNLIRFEIRSSSNAVNKFYEFLIHDLLAF